MHFKPFLAFVSVVLSCTSSPAAAEDSKKGSQFVRYYEVKPFTECPDEVLKTMPRLSPLWRDFTSSARVTVNPGRKATFKDYDKSRSELKYYEMKDGKCVLTTIPASMSRTKG